MTYVTGLHWCLLFGDQFDGFVGESLAKGDGSFFGEMDVAVGLFFIATVEVIGVDPGVALGFA